VAVGAAQAGGRAVNGAILWLPLQASDTAHRFDVLFFTVLGVTGAVAVAITFAIAWFVVRYHRGSNADRSHAPANARALEITWIIVPLVLFLAAGAWGATLYADLYRARADAMPVFVVGKQWMWKAQHANGRREINELHLPLGQSVQLVFATEDAIHSFY